MNGTIGYLKPIAATVSLKESIPRLPTRGLVRILMALTKVLLMLCNRLDELTLGPKSQLTQPIA